MSITIELTAEQQRSYREKKRKCRLKKGLQNIVVVDRFYRRSQAFRDYLKVKEKGKQP